MKLALPPDDTDFAWIHNVSVQKNTGCTKKYTKEGTKAQTMRLHILQTILSLSESRLKPSRYIHIVSFAEIAIVSAQWGP